VLLDVEDRNVHAWLTRSDQFVLTEHLGTYGLREWNAGTYKTVAERMEDALREAGGRMPIKRLVQTMADDGVPEGTARANLCNERFARLTKAMIGLAETSSAPASRDGQLGGPDVEVPDGDPGSGPRTRLTCKAAPERVTIAGEDVGVNERRQAVLLGCNLFDERFQRLARHARDREELPACWAMDEKGLLAPQRSRYGSQASWMRSAYRHLEMALFRIAREDGLLGPTEEITGDRCESADRSSGFEGVDAIQFPDDIEDCIVLG
jgi:hypothetical protein